MIPTQLRFATCLLFVLALASLPLTAGDREGGKYFLQYNLFHDDGEADWENFMDGEHLALGTEVVVTAVKKKKVMLDAGGKEIELNMKDVEPSFEEFLDGLLGDEAPSLDGLSEEDQKGIKYADIRVGMTRRAVFLAVGPPPYKFEAPFGSRKVSNPDPDANKLTWLNGFWDVANVYFEDDVVTSIDD